MSHRDLSVLEQFKWETQPAAGAWLRRTVDEFLSKNSFAKKLAQRMHEDTGTRFLDWVGHITLSPEDTRVNQLAEIGYEKVRTEEGNLHVYEQPGGMFPTVVVYPMKGATEIAIKVESVADFLAANGIQAEIAGEPLSDVRVCDVVTENNTIFSVIERHGNRSFAEPGAAPAYAVKRLKHLEALRTRPRTLDDRSGFEHAGRLIDAAIADLGRDLTCDLFFAAEREYWMSRNRAAQVQFARQQKLGLGWGNHDHHTYRSSRDMFPHLVAVWEKLGLTCRERFYAGLEAGWGAQVMEQPVTGIITFNDVDMSPEELMGDFSHEGFKEKRDKLGTIGLWCGLHGEAFLQAGMHHLEAQFDHHRLTRQLEEEHGIKTMKPFTSFQYLTQAFTEGERWMIDVKRLDHLLASNAITRDQFEQFKQYGAIGSHLENLERNDGFKGFNQKGVSEIIAATDPRKLTAALAGGH